MKGNILLLWDRMGDYHIARWKNLKQNYGRGSVFAANLAMSDKIYGWDNGHAEGHYTLSSKPIHKKDTFCRTRNFIKLSKEQKIKYLCVAGYAHIEYIFIIMLAKLLGIKILIFAESWYQKNKIKNKLKSVFLKLFAHKLFVSGKLAYHHFSEDINIKTSNLLTGYSVVDNAHFERKSTKLPKLDKTKTLLCIARFAPEKNLENLIKAFNICALKNWKLNIVGGGPLRENLEALIINDKVILTDWMAYRQLPSLYHSAHCFILPSKFEPWGLVINEAMSAALPITASQTCGCVPELTNTKNSWLFDPNNLDSLVAVINKLGAISLEELEKKGKKSKEIIENYSLNTWSQTIIQAFTT